MELKKIHEDKRGFIYIIENLLEGEREFSFLEIKKGFARGGCLHFVDENFVLIKGKVKFICGENEDVLTAPASGVIPANQPHAFVALEDSVVSEWGVTTTEKEEDKKDPELRLKIEGINNSH